MNNDCPSPVWPPAPAIRRMWSRDEMIALLKEVLVVEVAEEDYYVDCTEGWARRTTVKVYIDGEKIA